MLYYQSYPEENINKTVARLLDIANIIDKAIITVFNDVVITLEPSGKAEAIVALYFEKLRQRGEIQQMGIETVDKGMFVGLTGLLPTSAESIVRAAAGKYVKRYGRVPNICRVSPVLHSLFSLFPDEDIAGITIEIGEIDTTEKLWIGRSEK